VQHGRACAGGWLRAQRFTRLRLEGLEATILAAFLSELDNADEPTERGKRIDARLGLVAQLRVGYYD
jgi:hypothetical protein